MNNAPVGDNEFQNELSKSASAHSSAYVRVQSTVVHKFIESMEENAALAAAAEIVDDPDNPGQQNPRFIILLRNRPITDYKALRFMNKLLVNFFYKSKTISGKYFAASTWSTRLKTLLATLKRNFGLVYSAGDFKGFAGSLYDVEVKLWEDLQKSDPNFSKGRNGSYTQEEYEQVEEYLNSEDFRRDANDGNNLMMAMNHAVGTTFALRGRKEHKSLTLDSFSLGIYETGHPWAGKEFLALKDQDMISKTHRLRPGTSAFCSLLFADTIVLLSILFFL